MRLRASKVENQKQSLSCLNNDSLFPRDLSIIKPVHLRSSLFRIHTPGCCMRFRVRWPVALFLLIFVLLFARLCLTLGTSSIGWRLLADQWADQIHSLVDWSPPLRYEPPAQQSAYWLSQIAENEAARTEPEAALAAAWLLDAPQNSYVMRSVGGNLDENRSLTELYFLRREWPYEESLKMPAEFERLCRDACLEQSELATRLAPENQQLWRNRAFLLFQYLQHNRRLDEFVPRREDWLAVLDECARHDPENALYDYLAAYQLWWDSIELINDGWQKYIIRVMDQRLYQQFQERLRAGLKKPFLKTDLGEKGITFDYLSDSEFDLQDQITTANNSNPHEKTQFFLQQFGKTLASEHDSAINQSDFEGALTSARHLVRYAEQITTENADYFMVHMKLSFHFHGLIDLLKIKQIDINAFSAEEEAAISEQLSQLLLEDEVLHEVLNRDSSPGDDHSHSTLSLTHFRSLLATAISLNFFLITVCCLPLFNLPVWFFRKTPLDAPRGVRVPGILFCWLLGTGLSLLLSSLIFCEIIEFRNQLWVLILLEWTWTLLIFAGPLLLIRLGFNVDWSPLISLYLMLTAPILIFFYLVPHAGQLLQDLQKTPPATIFAGGVVLLLVVVLSLRSLKSFLYASDRSRKQKTVIAGLVLLLVLITVPLCASRVLELIKAGYLFAYSPYDSIRSLRELITPVTWRNVGYLYPTSYIPLNSYNLDDTPLTRTCLVWYWHAGEIFAVPASLAMLCFWSLKRQAYQVSGGFRIMPLEQKGIAILTTANLLTKTCACAAAVFLLIYLAITPSVLEVELTQTERNYQNLQSPGTQRQKLDALNAAIKADAAVMEGFRKDVELRKQELLEEEADDFDHRPVI